ncbi:MAG: DnaJ domain-containing protein, partial [Paracoccaceae bacterium]
GQYRAPKSPDILDDFFWFCKDHVREYNLKWNFFHGNTEEELAKQVDKDRVWERETKPFGKAGEEARAWSRLGIDDPHQVLGTNATQNPGKSITGTRRLPPTERKAIDILEAKEHWTKTEVRKQYKKLIKVLHPDMNGGDRSQEEQLQEVVWAWDQIKVSRFYRN